MRIEAWMGHGQAYLLKFFQIAHKISPQVNHRRDLNGPDMERTGDSPVKERTQKKGRKGLTRRREGREKENGETWTWWT